MFNHSQLNCTKGPKYPVSRGYIFTVWAVMRKVASANNHSIFCCACAKFITRLASKINSMSGLSSHGMSFEGIKKITTTLICYAKLMQCSKPVKNRTKTVLIYSDGLKCCQQKLLFACQLVQRKCSLCSPPFINHLWHHQL